MFKIFTRVLVLWEKSIICIKLIKIKILMFQKWIYSNKFRDIFEKDKSELGWSFDLIETDCKIMINFKINKSINFIW